MKKYLVLAFLFLSAPSLAWNVHGYIGIPQAPMQSVQLWGGGLVAHQNWVLNTGIHFQAPDGAGSYLVGNDNLWHQLVTDRSFAAANCDTPNFSVDGSCFGTIGTGTSQLYQISNNSVVSICGSPANSARAFMYAGGWLFRSDNIDPTDPDSAGGKNTWRNVNQLGNTSSWPNVAKDNANVTNRQNGDFIACDPNNQDHVIVGTQNQSSATGVRESYDGGVNFTTISSAVLPNSTATNNYIMAFDASSGTSTVLGHAVTSTFCVWTNGAPAGVYCTIDGNTADLAITGSTPTLIQHLAFDASHVLYGITGATFAGAGAKLNKYTVNNPLSGNWGASSSLTTPANLRWIAIDPNNQNHMVAIDIGAQAYVTTTGDGGWSNTAVTRTAPAGGDSPWLALIAADLFPQGYSIEFDPLNTGNMEAAAGQGTWTTTFGAISGGTFTLTSHNKGVMHPVGFSQVIPKPLTVLQGLQDITGMTTNISNLSSLTVNPLAPVKSLAFNAGVAVSRTDPNFTLARNSPNLAPGAAYDATSSDNFTTSGNLIPINNWYAQFPQSNVTNSGSGCSIGCVQISLVGTGFTVVGTKAWAQGDTVSSASILCSVATANTNPTFAANNLNSSGVCYEVLSVDPVGNTLTLNLAYNVNMVSPDYTASYKLWSPTLTGNFFNELNITNVQDDGTGKVQISVFNSGGSVFTTGAFVDISAVVMTGGSTPVNGRYKLLSKNNNCRCFTLDLSSSAGIGTYSSGGAVSTWPEAGGFVSAASNTNIVMAPSDNATPQCSMNGGKSWAPVTNGAIPATKSTITGGPYTAGATSFTVNNTSIPTSDNVLIAMDDGRYMYMAVTRSGTTISSTTVGTATGHITGTTLTLDSNLSPTNPGLGPGDGISVGASANTYILSGTGAASGSTFTVNNSQTVGAGTAMTFTQYAVPIGRTISAGAAVVDDNGWPSQHFNASIVIDADWVTPNTWYAANAIAGLISWTGCGATTLVNASNEGWLAQGAGSMTLKTVPNNAGHMLFTTGPQGGTLGISTNGLWRSCNAGVNFERVNGFFAPARIGLGHPKPGGLGYPSILVYGFYDPGNVEANAVNGLWESTDDPNQGNSGTCMSGGTFHKITDWPSAFPGGPKWMNLPLALDGDPPNGFYGPIYYQTNAGGFFCVLPSTGGTC